MKKAILGVIDNLEEELNQEIKTWHNAPHDPEIIGEHLHFHLGMTWKEYARWIEEPNSLPDIVAQAKDRQDGWEILLEDALCDTSPEQVLDILRRVDSWIHGYCKVCGVFSSPHNGKENCKCFSEEGML